ncbi:MAG: proteasome assembly chaperone family protein [Methanomicrobia archaeon]|nr:proteasome assembly chaperone family protein [Methanomicrobia archaeon]RLF95113.1 MAG: proteasome assembly chaperone family protein [Thermococci archaeon]HDN82016.1 proteasome assembly chaperone family protein [Methanomicrobia archaeon]
MIDLYKFKDVDLKDGTVIVGHPSVGMISSIAISYLVDKLDLDQVAALDSDQFPPIALVFNNKPKCPARIYAREDLKIAAIVSEFVPSPLIVRPLARKILEWAEENGCKRIITLEGLVSSGDGEIEIYHVNSLDKESEKMKKMRISAKPLNVGMITGVSAVLLNEGRRENFDVICLLGEARPNIPDSEAAAKLVGVVDQIFPEIKIDVSPLLEDAKMLEERMKKLKQQAKPAVVPKEEAVMYR